MKKLELVQDVSVFSAEPRPRAPLVARVADINEAGRLVLNTVSGENLEARMVARLGEHAPQQLLGREALVIFENEDPDLPIVVDLMHDPSGLSEALAPPADEEESTEAEINGKTIVIKADERLELRVGKASIVIDANGKITTRSQHLLNRATGPIRIKGGHVDIN